MRKSLFFLGLAAFWPAIPRAHAVDHNNLDAGRPLDFDDAQSVAFREKSLEIGAVLGKPKNGNIGVAGAAEYLYGFAPNSHFSLDFAPRFVSQGGEARRFDAGDVGIGVFHNFQREIGKTPAFSLRADAQLPTGRGSRGLNYRLRAIASRHLGYSQLHLNLDWEFNGNARSNEKKQIPGVILGYSRPLGLPRRFDRTLVAQIGYSASPTRGKTETANIGIGLRQQIGLRSVFDVGLKSQLSGGPDRETVQLVAGYSRQF